MYWSNADIAREIGVLEEGDPVYTNIAQPKAIYHRKNFDIQ